MKNLKLATGLIMILSLMLLITACQSNKQAGEPTGPAPSFTLTNLDGGETTVPADFTGRAVLLQFFSLG